MINEPINEYELYRAEADIDLSAVRRNLRAIMTRLPKGSKSVAVVKSNAYGHGALPVSLALEKEVSAFAVAVPTEAQELRAGGITKPIYILGYSHPSSYPIIVCNHITPAIFKYEDAELLSKEALSQGMDVRINIKVDTGMGRIGFAPTEACAEVVAKIAKLPGIVIHGVFTHFATADMADKTYANEQYGRFRSFIAACEKRGVKFSEITCDNTAGAMEMLYASESQVRVGVGLYGYYPSDEVSRSIALEPVLKLKSHIVYLKEIEAGQTVSYGRTFTAPRKMKIATVPVGYADGFPRALSNKGYVMVRGKRAPIVGRVCMDMFMIDVTDIDAEDGDEVILIGDGISAEDIAKLADTISYEILCGIGKRVMRVYKE